MRNNLAPGDIVVFFAVRFNLSRDNAKCFLSAALTVQASVSQEGLFRQPKLSNFTQYLNLLIRPIPNGWEHFEPALPRDAWHSDWLWRVCHHQGLRKAAFLEAGREPRIGILPMIGGIRTGFAANHIIFSTDLALSVVLGQPPLVARWHKPDPQETWLHTEPAISIYSLVFIGTNRRHLRTSNRQQPHRHFWIGQPSEPGRLPKAFFEALSGA